MSEVTFKTRDVIIATILSLGAMVAYAVYMPKTIPQATAAGAPANACVAPPVTNAVPSTSAVTEAAQSVAPVSTATHTETTTTTPGHTHNGEVNVVRVDHNDVDVTTGDILSDLVDVSDVTVTVDRVLNPTTQVLGGVLSL